MSQASRRVIGSRRPEGSWMIDIGSYRCRTCEGVSRRTFLRAGVAAPCALGAARAAGVAAAESPKAKSVLLIWLGGGPSHLDLFDPKPRAPVEYRGPFATIATRTPGVRFTELLPKLAARSDRFSLVRSNINFDGDHLLAGSIALTGAAANAGTNPPNFGSIVARRRGSSELPPFISLARGPIGDGRGPLLGYGGGTWGQGFDPFMVSCSERGDVDIPDLKLFDGLTPARLSDRQFVLKELDAVRRQFETTKFEQWDGLHRQAYALLTSTDGRRVFDLARESSKMREAY